MCEFTILKLEKGNEKTSKIGEDVMYMKYNSKDGASNFADILGRPSGVTNAFITEINMFESRHDITVIESDLAPFISKFMISLNSNNKGQMKEYGNMLIAQIQSKLNEI